MGAALRISSLHPLTTDRDAPSVINHLPIGVSLHEHLLIWGFEDAPCDLGVT